MGLDKRVIVRRELFLQLHEESSTVLYAALAFAVAGTIVESFRRSVDDTRSTVAAAVGRDDRPDITATDGACYAVFLLDCFRCKVYVWVDI